MTSESGLDESFSLEHLSSLDGRRLRVPSSLHSLDPTEVTFADESSDDESVASAISEKERPSARAIMRIAWKILLALSALMDCLSTLLHERLVTPPCETEEASECILGKLTLFGRDYTLSDPRVLHLLGLLDDHAVNFGFLFSLLWCVQAFRDARKTRLKALRERDKKRLMVRGESLRYLGDDDDDYYGGIRPWIAFYSTLILELLLVPVGFYALLYYQGVHFLTAASSENMHEIVEEMETTSEQNQTLQNILNSTFQVVETSMENPAKNARLSVGVLLAKNAGHAFMNAFGRKLKKWAVKKGLKEGGKLGLRAIVKPRKVWKQARKAIKWARWTKYLAPLIATANKLRENVCDLLKKYRQRREAVLAMKIRKILWQKMTPVERKNKAARGIQSCWRSYQVRRLRWALALIQCRTDEIAAIRVQTFFRSWLHRARSRIRQKRAELKELEARERLVVRGARRGAKRMTMSPIQRKRLYQLQDEMKISKTKSIDRRLLLRPNTRFAVIWKAIFVFCVLIEITNLAVNPVLASRKVKVRGTKQPLTFTTALEDILIAPPVSSLQACSCRARVREEFNSLILAKVRPTRCPSDPWYCGQAFSTAQGLYTTLIRFLLHHFMMIVGIICFLDVFVYHYTGEIDAEGVVIPKHFFDRWIAPGLLLQLVVNPEMESTAKLIFNVIATAMEVGPFRVLRWVEALFHPCLVLAVDLIEYKFWIPAVARLNQSKVEPSMAEEEHMPLAVRRRTTIMRRASLAVGQNHPSLAFQRRKSSLMSSTLNFHPTRSSLLGQPKRSSLVPLGRRSSIQSSARTRRSAFKFLGTTPLMDIKEKMS